MQWREVDSFRTMDVLDLNYLPELVERASRASEELWNRLHIFQFKRWHGHKRHLLSPSGLSSNHKDNLYVYNVPNFSNCFPIFCVITHINSSRSLDMLYRKQGFITNKKEFYCNVLDKIDFHCDEH